MSIRPITPDEKAAFDHAASHPLQAYNWGVFREKTGVQVIRRGIFEGENLIDTIQLTLHPIPKTPFTIGYFPKGRLPSTAVLKELEQIGKQHRSIFMQLEPNVIEHAEPNLEKQFLHTKFSLRPSFHPLFTKYTFILDLTQSEEALLAAMHAKTRYNIRVAERHGVTVTEENTPEAFQRYLELTEETTKRQGFYAHSRRYHELQWETLPHTHNTEELSSHLLVSRFAGKILTAWIVFVLHDTLYYPYGASSSEHRETMHSTQIMWEAIRFGKKLGLKHFDMWGAATTSDPPPSDPYYGFHRFKKNFGPTYTEFIGSYDFVLQPLLYQGYKLADTLRWSLLKRKQ